MSEPNGTPQGWGPAPEQPPGYTAPPGTPSDGPAPPGSPQYSPQYGQAPAGPPPYGQGQYGQPQYGPGQYGQPQYGQPQYGQPQYGQGQFGQGQFGAAPGYRPPPVQRGIVPLRPLGLGEIFDGAFRSVRANPRVMFGFTAVVVGIGSLLGALTQVILIPMLAGWTATASGTELDPYGTGAAMDSMAFSLSSVGMVPWMLLAQAILTGILTVSVSRSVIGQKATVGELWSKHWKHVLVLGGLGLLYMLASLAVWALLVLGVIALASSGATGAAVALGLIGGLLLIIASFWITIRVLLVPPVLVLEGAGAWASVARGWRLSRGSFWRLLGIYLLAQLIVGFVSQIVITPVGMVSGFALIAAPQWIAVAVMALGTGIVYTLTIVFTSAVVALLYVDVRIRREGLDVELARAAEAVATDPSVRAA